MQVSFACTEHNLKSRSEDRLCGLRSAPPPGGSSGGGGGAGSGLDRSGVQVSNGNYATQNSIKIRDITTSRVAMHGHAHMKEAFGRHSSMKYR